MRVETRYRAETTGLTTASSRELLGDLARETAELVRKEVQLAKSEIKANMKSEVRTAEGLGVAGVCAALTGLLLLVAIILALATVMPGWAATLIVAAAVLLVGTVAGLAGWKTRVRHPMEKTERTLKEDLRWAKAQVR